MSLIHGETVKLTVKTKTGTDSFGCDVCNETLVEVSNVIIGTPTFEQQIAELNLTGKRLAFILGIPKGDSHEWEDTTVLIRNKKFRTYGNLLIQTEANVPGEWNGQIKVERYE